MSGELIEEGIGCRVVRLPRIAQNAGDAGEQNEEIQIAVLGGAVQMPGAQRLGPQHPLEPFPALVRQCSIRQHAHTVDHPPERRQRRVHVGQHGVHPLRVGHVRQFHLHRHAALPQLADGLLGLGAGGAPAVEHDGARAVIRQPVCHHQADPAHSAGDQVAPVVAQPPSGQRRVCQHDLADMPRRPHALHGRTRLRQGPPGVEEGIQLAGRQPIHHPPQDLAGMSRLLFLQGIDLEDGVVHVRPDGRHLLLAQDVHPGHFHEPTPARQAGETGIDEAFAGQAVQHHVDPGATRSFENLLPEGGRAAVEHLFYAERAEIFPLASACGGEHFRAGCPHQLDGCQSDPAGAGVNQHAVTGLQPAEVER